MKKTWIYILMAAVVCFIIIGCDKKGLLKNEEEEEEEQEQVDKELKAHAAYNASLLEGVGNVFVANALQSGGKQQLYAKANYNEGHLAYYVSPVSGQDIGTDHRIVFGARKGEQVILEMNESEQLLSMYTEREGVRLPIVLQMKQYGDAQFELQLFRIDWSNQVQELVSSVYVREGKTVSSFKVKAKNNTTPSEGGLKAAIGFPGVKRPSVQSSVSGTTAAFLAYIHSILNPVIKESNEGMGSISLGLENNSITSEAFGSLWYDLGALNAMLNNVGSVFGSFQTDPIATNEPLKSFSWYKGMGDLAVDIENVQLSAIMDSSLITYDELDINARLRLVLQVEDKDKKALIDRPVFVDFKIELEQDGQTHLLSVQTVSSTKKEGLAIMQHNLYASALKPKVGSKLNILYRLSAKEGGVFAKQEVKIIDQKPAKIEIVSGNDQTADWEEKLKNPLVIKVTNAAGTPLKDIAVSWKVQSVSWGIIVGTLSDTQFKTDDRGLAQTYYTVGKQQQKPESVLVKAYDRNGAEITGLETTFTYKQKRRNFSLVQLKPKTDNFDYIKTDDLRDWKNGDKVTIMENESIAFHIKEDGKILNFPDGTPAHFIQSMKGFIVNTKYDGKTFQSKDILLEDWPIKFSDPKTGRMDSVVIDLTISNQLYRTIVGKTIQFNGGGIPENGNTDEVLNFKYRTDGKVEIKSLKYAQSNAITTFESFSSNRFVPYYNCTDPKTGIMPYTMKEIVGIVTSPVGPQMAYGMNAALIVFADGSIKPLSMGTGYDNCTYNKFWGQISIK